MEWYNVLLVRHAAAEGPDGTVLQSELNRAYEMGKLIAGVRGLHCNVLTHSSMLRAALTGAALMAGMGTEFRTVEAIPELGNEKLFAAMMAPDGMRERAAQVGHFEALTEKHGRPKAIDFAEGVFAGFKRGVLDKAVAGDCWCVVCHSPVIELLAWRFCNYLRSNAYREELKRMDYLEAIHLQVPVGDNGSFVDYWGKFTAPSREIIPAPQLGVNTVLGQTKL